MWGGDVRRDQQSAAEAYLAETLSKAAMCGGAARQAEIQICCAPSTWCILLRRIAARWLFQSFMPRAPAASTGFCAANRLVHFPRTAAVAAGAPLGVAQEPDWAAARSSAPR